MPTDGGPGRGAPTHRVASLGRLAARTGKHGGACDEAEGVLGDADNGNERR